MFIREEVLSAQSELVHARRKQAWIYSHDKRIPRSFLVADREQQGSLDNIAVFSSPLEQASVAHLKLSQRRIDVRQLPGVREVRIGYEEVWRVRNVFCRVDDLAGVTL